MKKLLLSSLITVLVLAMPGIASADENYCEVYDKGIQTIESDKISAFEENLRSKVKYLNSNENIDDSFMYVYRYRINTINTETRQEKINVERIYDKTDFLSEREAIDYYNKIEMAKPYEKQNPIVIKSNNKGIIKGEEKNIVCSSINCERELEEINRSLGNNEILGYKDIIYTEITLPNEVKEVEYKENENIKYFNTESAAKDFASAYRPVLEGYEFVENNIIPIITVNNVTKTYKELKGNNIFDTKEEAQRELDNFKEEYSNITGEIKENNYDNVKENPIKEAFTTEESANNRKNELVKDDHDETITVVGPIKEEINGEEEKVNETYSSLELANEALKKLRDEGYNVENIQIIEVPGELTGNVKNITKVDKNLVRYDDIDGDNNYILIKQGRGNIVVWTKTSLSEEAEDNFKEKFFNQLTDGSVTVNDTFHFISGEGTFNIATLYNLNNWGEYTFKYENGKLMLYNPQGKISHIYYGIVESSNSKYKLEGTKYKIIDNWYIEYTKIKHLYNYSIEATADVEEKETKYIIKSKFVKKGMQANLSYRIDTEYDLYNLSYETYIPKLTEISEIEWIIEREKLPIGTGDIEELPPQTGVNANNLYEYLLLISMILLSLKGYKKVKETL